MVDVKWGKGQNLPAIMDNELVNFPTKIAICPKCFNIQILLDEEKFDGAIDLES